jgi:hypothetical protein
MIDKDIADRYYNDYLELKGSKNFELHDSWDEVKEIITSGGEEAVALIEELCKVSDDREYLAYVGAGPLEDFFVYHADDRRKQIESLAARSDNFRYALSCVWQNDMNNRTYIWIRSLLNASGQKNSEVKTS